MLQEQGQMVYLMPQTVTKQFLQVGLLRLYALQPQMLLGLVVFLNLISILSANNNEAGGYKSLPASNMESV